MSNFFKKLKLNIVIFFNSLFRGMKSADEVISNSNKNVTGSDSEQEKKIESNNLYAALLRGEVTQEVKDLRYETYQAAKKADEYKYVGGGQAVKKSKNEIFTKANKNICNEEEYSVVIIQKNDLIKKSVSEELGNLLSTGKEGKVEHRLKIKRKWLSRFNIEDYASQLIIRKDGETYYLDFYVPAGPQENEPKAIFFDKEMKTLYERKSRMSDITDFDNVSFISEKAFPVEDLLEFSFINLEYVGIKYHEKGGSYVLTFTGTPEKLGVDIAEDMYDEESKRKFEAKEERKNRRATPLKEAIENIEAAENANKIDIEESKKLLEGIRAGKVKKNKQE